MSAFAKVAAEFGTHAFEYLHNQGFFEKFYNEIFNRNKRVLILGASGAGKTQFVNSFNKEIADIQVVNRTHTSEKTNLTVDKIPLKFFDTPGHGTKQEVRRQEIDNLILKRTKYVGIINVVSYGYHERENNEKIVFDEKGKVKNEIIEQHRKEELRLLDEWLPILRLSSVKWVITLVTKADIWWDFEDDVYEYYRYGKYRRIFDEKFSKDYYSKQLYFIPYCSLREPYYKKLQANTFGVSQKNNLTANFVKNLSNILGKENNIK